MALVLCIISSPKVSIVNHCIQKGREEEERNRRRRIIINCLSCEERRKRLTSKNQTEDDEDENKLPHSHGSRFSIFEKICSKNLSIYLWISLSLFSPLLAIMSKCLSLSWSSLSPSLMLIERNQTPKKRNGGWNFPQILTILYYE